MHTLASKAFHSSLRCESWSARASAPPTRSTLRWATSRCGRRRGGRLSPGWGFGVGGATRGVCSFVLRCSTVSHAAPASYYMGTKTKKRKSYVSSNRIFEGNGEIRTCAPRPQIASKSHRKLTTPKSPQNIFAFLVRGNRPVVAYASPTLSPRPRSWALAGGVSQPPWRRAGWVSL